MTDGNLGGEGREHASQTQDMSDKTTCSDGKKIENKDERTEALEHKA